MPRFLLCAALFLAPVVGVRAQQAAATYVDAAKVAAGGTFVRAADHSVQMLKRTAPGEAEVHTRETDIFYIVEGEATFVTGGTVVGGKETQPNQIRGTSISNGETHHLKRGDTIEIPAGVPHWFKEVPQPISYLTVKLIKP